MVCGKELFIIFIFNLYTNFLLYMIDLFIFSTDKEPINSISASHV